MKKILLIAVIIAVVGTITYRTTLRERELVILSTNDMHANIENFPSLVTAVKCCRDSVTTILVDAGDRWTGNVYVDLAEGRLPIIELMNYIGYDVATLGNHEFDKGAAMLQGAVSHASFPIVCANMQSNREELSTLPSSTVITTKDGVKIAVAGVVTTFDGGHPEGSDEVYRGLSFCDPFQAAAESFARHKSSHIRLLLSHMGDDKDVEFASTATNCDIIISGHTHNVVDTVVGDVTIGQTGRKLKHVGATKVKLRGNKVVSIDYQNIPLAGYEKDCETVALVEQIEANPQLKEVVGSFASEVTHVGFANMLTKALTAATSAQIGFYHYGGIRLAEHAAGDVALSTVYNLEPFESKMHTITMTTEQIRQMIIAKFNDTINTKESHRVDLFSNTPYEIVVDSRGEAVDVRLPKLRAGAKYRVVMADYIGKKYPSIEGESRVEENILVTDALLSLLKQSKITPIDNQPRQKIVKR